MSIGFDERVDDKYLASKDKSPANPAMEKKDETNGCVTWKDILTRIVY